MAGSVTGTTDAYTGTAGGTVILAPATGTTTAIITDRHASYSASTGVVGAIAVRHIGADAYGTAAALSVAAGSTAGIAVVGVVAVVGGKTALLLVVRAAAGSSTGGEQFLRRHLKQQAI